MTAATVSPHPLQAAVAKARAALAEVAELQPVYMSPDQRSAALVELVALENQVAERKLTVLAASDDLGEAIGARDAGAWLTRIALVERRAAIADVKLAKAIDQKYPGVGEAMRAGGVNRAQASVIVQALDALSDEVDVVTRRRAERDLIGFAGQHDPQQLRQLGERILEVVAPEIAEAADARALEREEQRAHNKASVLFRNRGEGTRIIIDTSKVNAARFAVDLDALCSPRQEGADDGTDRLPLSRRRGHAFETLLERLDPKTLPDHGGHPTSLFVTTSLEDLRTDLATATVTGSFDGDLRISATETRRLACNANIIPVVLGGKGEVLDLGRSRRLYSTGQVRALRLRDKRCRAEGCAMPAAMCEAHHKTPWSEGGRTNLDDGVLLCNRHHHVIHDSRYATTKLANGDYRFHRRT